MEVNKNNSRPWKPHGTYDTYEEAKSVREGLLELDAGLEVKIRRRHSKNKFSLKTRDMSAPTEEKPKSGKSKRRNRKTPEGRKFVIRMSTSYFSLHLRIVF